MIQLCIGELVEKKAGKRIFATAEDGKEQSKNSVAFF